MATAKRSTLIATSEATVVATTEAITEATFVAETGCLPLEISAFGPTDKKQMLTSHTNISGSVRRSKCTKTL